LPYHAIPLIHTHFFLSHSTKHEPMVFSASMIWATRDVLHRKNSQVVPGVLLLAAGSLIAYRHAVADIEDDGRDLLKEFLGMILIQMLPLVILEMRIMSCEDPVGAFCKFSGPVTLMHAVFLSLRLCNYALNGTAGSFLNQNVCALIGTFATMHIGFREKWSLGSIIVGHSAAWRLAALAYVAAYFTEGLVYQTWGILESNTLLMGTNYIELLAFAPAVCNVCRQDAGTRPVQIESAETKRRTTAFFLFLVTFYFWEDLGQAYSAYPFSGLASAAHILHFLLLVDFAFYILAHIYNPDKLVGELQKWLPADLRCAV